MPEGASRVRRDGRGRVSGTGREVDGQFPDPLQSPMGMNSSPRSCHPTFVLTGPLRYMAGPRMKWRAFSRMPQWVRLSAGLGVAARRGRSFEVHTLLRQQISLPGGLGGECWKGWRAQNKT